MAALFCAGGLRGEGAAKLLLFDPTLSKTQIAFTFGGDIWIVARSGGEAHRLVTSAWQPLFSPDGTKVAFTKGVDGNTDVYVVDAAGGVPTRLTYHPDADVALGWTPDGTRVLFGSNRVTFRDLPQLFTVPLSGGLPQELPLPSGTSASFSPDGTHLAYVPITQSEPDWKMYRGGQTTPIWIADLADSSVTKIPRDNSTDRYPMWSGDKVYFLSDREGRYTLYSYDTKAAKVSKLLDNDGFDIRSANAGPGGIVYSQFGSLHIYDFESGKAHKVDVHIAADLPHLRPHFEKVKPEQILSADISPTGKRAVFEAHGDIFSVPAEKGDVRNLTRSTGVADRDPAWSPDGKSIAYFSDATGEYELYVRSQDGLSPAQMIDLGKPGSFFYSPRWSPDSTKILYTDKRLKLWYVGVTAGTPVPVDEDPLTGWGSNMDPAWSADGMWITYTKVLGNHLHAVFIYSLADKSIHQVTDGMSDAASPRFDRNGKYLYFTTSTQRALAATWIDMSGFNHPMLANVYAAVLRKDLPSPLAPESDEEDASKDADSASKDKAPAKDVAPPDVFSVAPQAPTPAPAAPAATPSKPKTEPVLIDFDGLDQRIVAMPLATANYADLQTGKDGVLFVFTGPSFRDVGSHDEWKADVSKFDLKTRKTEPVAAGISGWALSANGEKLLIAKDHKWIIQDAEKMTENGKGVLPTENLEVYVDPQSDWRQMYHEVWRIERDFFYDPGYHGLDIAAAEKLYEPSVPRDDGLDGRRPHVHLGRRPRRWAPRHGGPAGRRLRRRERPLPSRPHLQGRELEPGAAGPAHATRGKGEGGRLPVLRQRALARGLRRGVQPVSGDRGKADRDPRGVKAGRQRRP